MGCVRYIDHLVADRGQAGLTAVRRIDGELANSPRHVLHATRPFTPFRTIRMNRPGNRVTLLGSYSCPTCVTWVTGSSSRGRGLRVTSLWSKNYSMASCARNPCRTDMPHLRSWSGCSTLSTEPTESPKRLVSCPAVRTCRSTNLCSGFGTPAFASSSGVTKTET